MDTKIIPHPLNAAGDFIVENGRCIACLAPEASAPNLMAHDESGHCYFKCQPKNEEETYDAILAMKVSCCGAVQYVGKDKSILFKIKHDICSKEDDIKFKTKKSWYKFW